MRAVGRVGPAGGARAAMIGGVVLALLAPALSPGAPPFRSDGRPAPASPSLVLRSGPNLTFPTPIRHVFLVVLENAERSTVLADGPFERHLANSYATATHYYAVCHPSAPNYLALTSGAAWQCGSDGYSTYATENIGDLVERSGMSWAAFEESMPSACDMANSYPYAVKHNPIVYYRDIVSNGSECRSHDLPFSNWTTDVAAGDVPNFAMFTPNLTDDGHDTGVGHADAWLNDWISPLLNDSFFATSVFFVVYDEGVVNGVDNTTGYNGTVGGNVFFAAISPYVAPGTVITGNVSHYDLLATMEWLLGLGNCGQNDSTGAFPAMKSLFPLAASYAVSGTVTSTATALPIAGATVALTAQSDLATNASGDFSFLVSNGTYLLNVSAPGYWPSSRIVVVNGSPDLEPVGLAPRGAGPNYAISGFVRTLSNQSPISGASVGVENGPSTTTAATGAFHLEETNGTYTVTASAPGYVSEQASVSVEGGPAGLDFNLSRPSAASFRILGTVRAAVTGDPLSGATVALSPGSPDRTNATGGYELDVGNGTYTLDAAATGYRSNGVGLSLRALWVYHNSPRGGAAATPPAMAPPAGTSPLVWVGLGVATAVAIVAVAVRLRRRRPE